MRATRRLTVVFAPPSLVDAASSWAGPGERVAADCRSWNEDNVEKGFPRGAGASDPCGRLGGGNWGSIGTIDVADLTVGGAAEPSRAGVGWLDRASSARVVVAVPELYSKSGVGRSLAAGDALVEMSVTFNVRFELGPRPSAGALDVGSSTAVDVDCKVASPALPEGVWERAATSGSVGSRDGEAAPAAGGGAMEAGCALFFGTGRLGLNLVPPGLAGRASKEPQGERQYTLL